MARFYLTLTWLGIAVLTVVLGWSLALTRVYGRNLDGKWDNSPNRAWYAQQRLTAEAQKRLGFASCCSEGDEYPTEFRVVADGTKYGADRYFYLKDGQWLLVPEDIVKEGETPDGGPHIWLFPYDSREDVPQGTPVCFIIPRAKY